MTNKNKIIPLKTDEDYYNKQDFIQVDDSMEELTVEITLAEFRNMIRTECYQSARITELKGQLAAAQAEVEKLRSKVEALRDGTDR